MLDGVSFCGGEPTLQPELPAIAKQVKDMGFLVKIDTNGRDADLIISLVDDGIVDFVAVDCKNSWHKREQTIGVPLTDDLRDNFDRLLRFLRDGSVAYEYRTTLIK